MQSSHPHATSATLAAALLCAFWLAVAPPAAVEAQSAGKIDGAIKTSAVAPQAIRVTIDQHVCGFELPDESIVSGAGGGLANVVVTLAGVKAEGAADGLVVMNDKCRFLPRVQVTRPRAVVKTSSVDRILHNTNAQQDGGRTLFNIGLPAPGITVARPVNGPGLVKVLCNVHPWMRAWIVVTDDLAAVTTADGRFTFPAVPPGQYEVRFWHESLKAAPQTVVVKQGATATVAATMQ